MPNYEFPSSQKFSMTEIEGRSLRRKKKIRFDFIDWFLILLFMLSLVVVASLIKKHVLDPMQAEAAELPMTDLEVHEDFQGQTREYCTKILSV